MAYLLRGMFAGVLIGIFCVIVVISYAKAEASATLIMPVWVKSQLVWFLDGGSSPKKALVYERPLAYGDGDYRGEEMDWFAYTDQNGIVQFNMTAKLDEGDLKQVSLLKDDLGNRWAATTDVVGRCSFFGPGTATWVSTSNDWALDGEVAAMLTNEQIVGKYVEQMNAKFESSVLRLWVLEGF